MCIPLEHMKQKAKELKGEIDYSTITDILIPTVSNGKNS